MGDYIPLATSPPQRNQEQINEGDDWGHRNVFNSRSRREQFPPYITNRRLATLLGISILALAGVWTVSHRIHVPPKYVNPYFRTGKIWDHNDQVSARLDRCASLGLLRNTSLPLPPLPDVEEQALIAEGCGTNETTIILLASLWTSEAYSGKAPTGEVIYAQSVIQTLNANDYAFMFSNLGWWNYDMAKTVEIWKRHRWNIRFVMVDPEQAKECWKHESCLKTEDNLDGIEAWRLLSFWYWDDPGNPLGKQFTLSPFIRNDNFHLSLSIEPTCKSIPALTPFQKPRIKLAYLLSKQMRYMTGTTFSWTIPGLAEIQSRLGIKILGGLEVDRPFLAEMFQLHNLTNLGQLNKTEFYTQLAMSSVLVGVGKPRISPSPWDALCMGVSFINPILQWDENDPENRTSWHTQQWHMTDMQPQVLPPYVYHVHAHDLDGLERAIKTAIARPIKSYIPEYMRFDHVRRIMADVVEGDWRGKSAVILAERIASGEGDLFLL